MEHGKRWIDGNPARLAAEASVRDTFQGQGTPLERLSAAWTLAGQNDAGSMAESLRRDAEERMSALSPELARAGLHAKPATVCGTLWTVHCTITGARAAPTLTIFQLEQALAECSAQ